MTEQTQSILALSAALKQTLADEESQGDTTALLDLIGVAMEGVEAIETTSEAAGARALMSQLHHMLSGAPTHTRRTVTHVGIPVTLFDAYMYADLDWTEIRDKIEDTVITQFLASYNPPTVNLLDALTNLVSAGHGEAAHYMLERYTRLAVDERTAREGA